MVYKKRRRLPAGRRKHDPRIIIAAAAAALILCAALALIIFKPFSGRNTPAPSPSPSPAQTNGIASETPAVTDAPQPSPAVHAFERTTYDVNMFVDPDTDKVEGSMTMHYVNRSSDELYCIYAYAYANAVSPSCFRVSRVSINNREAYFETQNNGMILVFPVLDGIEPGGAATVYFEFECTLPKVNGRLGHGTNAVMLGNFLPIAAVYEDGEWQLRDYVSYGDSFYSDTADYRVVITAHTDYTVAATGVMKEKQTSAKGLYYEAQYFEADNVRSFAAALIKNADVYTCDVDGVKVTAYSFSSSAWAKPVAMIAADAIRFYSRFIAPYPYETFSIVESDIGGGMEYPQLVMIEKESFRSPTMSIGTQIIAHETAHQWWYGVVGSDEFREPWVDEALTEFCAYLFVRSECGVDFYETLWNGYVTPRLNDEGVTAVSTPLDGFEDGKGYFGSVYAKGAIMYRKAYEQLGSDKFFELLSKYFDEHKFSVAKGDDLVKLFADAGITLEKDK